MARMLFSSYWQTSRICQMHWMENNSRRNSNLTSTSHDCFSFLYSDHLTSFIPWNQLATRMLKGRIWRVQDAQAKDAHGLEEGFDWLCSSMKKLWIMLTRQTARKLPLSWLDSPSIFILARKSIDWLCANGEESVVYKVSPRTRYYFGAKLTLWGITTF